MQTEPEYLSEQEKAETDMYPSVVRNTCRTEARMAEMAAKVET